MDAIYVVYKPSLDNYEHNIFYFIQIGVCVLISRAQLLNVFFVYVAPPSQVKQIDKMVYLIVCKQTKQNTKRFTVLN